MTDRSGPLSDIEGQVAGASVAAPIVLAERVERTRARHPDESGCVDPGGVRIAWERYGSGERAVLLMPTWEIVHSREWKFQIPFLARGFTVVTDKSPPDAIAKAIAEEIGRTVEYHSVAVDGAARAAATIAEVLQLPLGTGQI